MPELEFSPIGKNDILIRLHGAISNEAIRELKRKIDELIASGGIEQCIFDLTECAYLNSNGLGTIIFEYMHLQQEGIRTVFISGTDQNTFVNRLLKETHLDKVFTYITTLGVVKERP